MARLYKQLTGSQYPAGNQIPAQSQTPYPTELLPPSNSSPIQPQGPEKRNLYRQTFTPAVVENNDADVSVVEDMRKTINEEIRNTPGLVDRKDAEEGKAEIRKIITTTFYDKAPFTLRNKADHYIGLFYDDLCGLGPLQPLLNQPTISEITVFGTQRIIIEEQGVEREVDVKFRDQDHIMDIIQRIVSPIGRKIDLMDPIVDAFLPDGSRVNITIPPVAVDGPYISIRKFIPQMDIDELCARGTFPEKIKEVLKCIAEGVLNTAISGGTSSGKTSLLNAICRYIPRKNESLIVIEDTLELDLHHPRVRRLLTRGANIEGKGEVTASDLVKSALRMKPTRIIVGEVRDKVILDTFNAMNSGHPGSFFSIHCNKPEDLPERIELMSGLAKESIHSQVSKIIDIVIQVNKLPDGRRRLTHISQFMGYENGKAEIQHLFEYDYEQDQLVRTIHPFRFEKELRAKKIEVPDILAKVGTYYG